MNFAKTNSWKGSNADVRLDCKYALASGMYWEEKLVIKKKFKTSLTLIWRRQEKNVVVFRRRFRTHICDWVLNTPLVLTIKSLNI